MTFAFLREMDRTSYTSFNEMKRETRINCKIKMLHFTRVEFPPMMCILSITTEKKLSWFGTATTHQVKPLCQPSLPVRPLSPSHQDEIVCQRHKNHLSKFEYDWCHRVFLTHINSQTLPCTLQSYQRFRPKSGDSWLELIMQRWNGDECASRHRQAYIESI